MSSQFEIWEFLAGLGIFLLAMVLLETALEFLAGRSFKKFLRRHTNHPIKAILSGIGITAILQSSSVVSLMVLAFVGAGIIELKNAIGIIIGSNLGTTLTGWVVAYFGFSFNIESFALPFLAFGGLSMVFFPKKETLYHVGQLFVGFGFLFLGLDYMKSSIDLFAQNFDISPFAQWNAYWFFLVGFVLTATIQSSSAAMVITLSALSANMIALDAAAAMVIGNDLGTTITVLFGGIKGTPGKKRVALSHFLFNFIVDLVALAALYPLLYLITQIWHFTNPLLTLVAFHSTFNLIGIILFLPFLGIFARFLGRRFLKDDEVIAHFITKVPAEVPEAGIEALNQEIRHLLQRVFVLNATILNLPKADFIKETWLKNTAQLSILDQYESIKELEGEITEYFINVQNRRLEREDAKRLQQLSHAIRYAMTGVKSIKDIAHNIRDFERSVNDEIIALTHFIKTAETDFYQQLFHIFQSPKSKAHFEVLSDLKKQSKVSYTQFVEKGYRRVQKDRFSDLEISTLFNVNREIHSGNKALIMAVKDLVLRGKSAADFESVPEGI